MEVPRIIIRSITTILEQNYKNVVLSNTLTLPTRFFCEKQESGENVNKGNFESKDITLLSEEMIPGRGKAEKEG